MFFKNGDHILVSYPKKNPRNVIAPWSPLHKKARPLRERGARCC